MAEPRRLASLGSLLDDQHWHRLAVERRGLHLNVTVDKHTEKVRMPSEFSHWDVQQVEQNAPRQAATPSILAEKCVFYPHAAERRDRSEPRASDIRKELPRLPGEPAVQRPQPDRAGQTEEPPGCRCGKSASQSLDKDHRS